MFFIVIAVHVVICLLLILIVLIQQGRGGGLIESFSSAGSILGTKTTTFLVKSTSFLATAFFLTCLTLAFLSMQKGRSLIDTRYRPEAEAPAAGTDAAADPDAAADSDAAADPDAAAEAPEEIPSLAQEVRESSTLTTGDAEDEND